MSEQWCPVPGWEDRYQVSDAGRVRSLSTGRQIRPVVARNGYAVVTLHAAPRRKVVYVNPYWEDGLDSHPDPRLRRESR